MVKIPKPPADNEWIADKLLGQEDTLLDALTERSRKKLHGEPVDDAPPAPEPRDRNPAEELAAHTEFLQFLAENPEDDCEVTALTADEFAEESFTPPATDTPEQTP